MDRDLQRGQVRDLSPTQLTGATVRQSGVEFSRQAPVSALQAPKDNNDELLVQSLAGFSKELGNVRFTTPKNSGLWEKVAATHSREQIFELQRTGRLPIFADPQEELEKNKYLGRSHAQTIIEEINQSVDRNEFKLIDDNGRPVPIGGIITQRMKERHGEENSAAFWKGASEQVISYADGLRTRQQAQVAAYNQNIFKDRLQAETDLLTRDVATNETLSDQDVATRVNATFRNLRGTAGTARDVNDHIVARAEDMSRKTPAEARAALRILNAPRVDDNGGRLDALANTPTYALQIQRVRENANEVFKKEVDDKAREAYIGAGIAALTRGDGSFNQLADQSYENPYDRLNTSRTLKSSDIRDEALTRWQTQLVKQAQRTGRDPQLAQTDIQQQAFNGYINSNTPNKQWRSMMDDTGKALADPQNLSNPQNMARAEASYSLYKELNTRSPAYLRNTLGIAPETRKLFEQAETYEAMGHPPTVAIERAANIISKPPPDLSPDERKLIREEARSSANAGWFSADGWTRGGWNGTNNVGDVQREFERVAETIAKDRGVSPTQAIAAAKKIVGERTVSINGRAFIGDPHVTKETAPLWRQRLEEVWEQEKAVLSKMEQKDRSFMSVRNIIGSAEENDLSIQELPGQSGIYNVMRWDQTTNSYVPLYLPRKREDGSTYAEVLKIHRVDIDRMKQERLQGIADKSRAKATADTSTGRYTTFP